MLSGLPDLGRRPCFLQVLIEVESDPLIITVRQKTGFGIKEYSRRSVSGPELKAESRCGVRAFLRSP
jgi:hypothetical protein